MWFSTRPNQNSTRLISISIQSRSSKHFKIRIGYFSFQLLHHLFSISVFIFLVHERRLPCYRSYWIYLVFHSRREMSWPHPKWSAKSLSVGWTFNRFILESWRHLWNKLRIKKKANAGECRLQKKAFLRPFRKLFWRLLNKDTFCF